MDREEIKVKINDVFWQGEVETDKNLLRFLREDLGMTGTKCSCEIGECGACTIILDALPVQSCLVLAVETDGKEITTVEGLATTNGLHPLQESFLDCFAVQCGFCTPGMLMAAKALLDKNPNPDDAEILNALRGHLCRCTGYEAIIAAVREGASRMQSGKLRNSTA